MSHNDKPTGWRERLHEIIFEADTPSGKFFDIALLISIVLSIVVVMLESMPVLNGYPEGLGTSYVAKQDFSQWFNIAEIIFTVIFTIEYVLRVMVIKKPWKYIFSFFGIIDLLSILPTYLGLIPAFQGQNLNLTAFRALRLLRVFRVLKLARYLKEANVLVAALKASRAKITVFLLAVLAAVIILGTIMYLLEGGDQSDFDSIPRSIYWAIVTLTTVGYGDISPQTDFGQFLAAMVMIMGYAIIAVPTGIVSAELAFNRSPKSLNTVSCQSCSREGHDDDAEFCKFCGNEL